MSDSLWDEIREQSKRMDELRASNDVLSAAVIDLLNAVDFLLARFGADAHDAHALIQKTMKT